VQVDTASSGMAAQAATTLVGPTGEPFWLAEFAAAASCSAWSAMALMADDAVLLVSWRSKEGATV